MRLISPRLCAVGIGITLFCEAASLKAADLKLASFFGDHMVLQRDHAIFVWGEGNPRTNVKVTIADEQVATTVGSDGRWQVRLGSVPAGGPYNLIATSVDSTQTVNDVLFGDVWLCSGQSNMQMPVKECDASEQKVMLTERPNLRLCSVAESYSADPRSSADIRWRKCTPESAQDFSAVSRFFAVELLKDPALANIPIGLIDSSYGGTACEGWIPGPALASFDAKDLHDSVFSIKPANLYNAMIAPLGQASLKGVLWYQDANNSAHPSTYPKLLSTMIAEWRRQFVDSELPFLIVQEHDYAKLWEGFYWPWIGEAQAQVVRSVPHTALVLAIETSDGFDLHPKQKLEIGRRSAACPE